MTKQFLAAFTGITIMVGACGGDGDDRSPGMADQVCIRHDIGDRYNRQTGGEITTANLASIADAEGRDADPLKDAGVLRGYFVYWQELVDRPPFHPPVGAVCEVLEFRTVEQAAAFVASLTVDNGTLPALTIGRLPKPVQTSAGELRPDGARTFSLRSGNGPGAVTVHLAIASVSNLVRVVYLGGEDTLATPEDAIALLARVTARAQPR